MSAFASLTEELLYAACEAEATKTTTNVTWKLGTQILKKLSVSNRVLGKTSKAPCKTTILKSVETEKAKRKTRSSVKDARKPVDPRLARKAKLALAKGNPKDEGRPSRRIKVRFSLQSEGSARRQVSPASTVASSEDDCSSMKSTPARREDTPRPVAGELPSAFPSSPLATRTPRSPHSISLSDLRQYDYDVSTTILEIPEGLPEFAAQADESVNKGKGVARGRDVAETEEGEAEDRPDRSVPEALKKPMRARLGADSDFVEHNATFRLSPYVSIPHIDTLTPPPSPRKVSEADVKRLAFFVRLLSIADIAVLSSRSCATSSSKRRRDVDDEGRPDDARRSRVEIPSEASEGGRRNLPVRQLGQRRRRQD